MLSCLRSRPSIFRRGAAWLAAAVLVASTGATARADIVVGAGSTSIDMNDASPGIIAVDETNTPTLMAGDYVATTFNYQIASASGAAAGGTVEPILLVGSGATFEVVAVGAEFTVPSTTGTDPFTSIAFGGTAAFTLASTESVYAGVYMVQADGDVAPIGFSSLGGTSFIQYSGPDPPVIGSALSGGSYGTFTRTYDFSVNIAAVPEPSSLMLGLIGGLSLLGYSRIRRREAVA